MKSVNTLIQLSAITLNAAFIGAMLLIALVLVPFWQAFAPSVFLDWFRTYAASLGSLMLPFGPGVLILAIFALALNRDRKLWWGLTILLTVANILYFPVYFLPTNNAFVEQTIPIAEVSGELNNWLNYHWQRIFFATGGLITSAIAVSRTMSRN